jgi:hypothetical protein
LGAARLARVLAAALDAVHKVADAEEADRDTDVDERDHRRHVAGQRDADEDEERAERIEC